MNDLPEFPELVSLSLGGNKISKFEDLKSLEKFENLCELDLTGCEIMTCENYREKIFKVFPNLIVIFVLFMVLLLKILDGCDKDGNKLDLVKKNYD